MPLKKGKNRSAVAVYRIVGKSWQFSKLPADPGMESMMALDDENINARGAQSTLKTPLVTTFRLAWITSENVPSVSHSEQSRVTRRYSTASR